MENSPKDQPGQNEKQSQVNDQLQQNATKAKANKYTPEEKKFTDGEGTPLDKAIDGDLTNPATRGE
ncbi:hypothetical protein FA048_09555 [Pedobacter polaris]|uniref:Uncharacterized protein n=1 Tax=Pedobacter polaris TaxID=2571273 RepID=A0A4U1CTL1_9SPHI|nr:hypothetical protein [Pedobacter polaris]TKC10425.1 hypothetical protein FA048_09555 [Pedobacter polaris]